MNVWTVDVASAGIWAGSNTAFSGTYSPETFRGMEIPKDPRRLGPNFRIDVWDTVLIVIDLDGMFEARDALELNTLTRRMRKRERQDCH
jgi:hypothetical protein